MVAGHTDMDTRREFVGTLMAGYTDGEYVTDIIMLLAFLFLCYALMKG